MGMSPLMAAEPEALDRILNIPSFRDQLAATQNSSIDLTMTIIGSAIKRLMEACNYSTFSSSQHVHACRARAQRRIPRLMFVLKKNGILHQQTVAEIFDEYTGVRPAALHRIPQQHRRVLGNDFPIWLDVRDVNVLITSMALCGIQPPDQLNCNVSLLGQTMSLLDSTNPRDWKPESINLIKLIMRTCNIGPRVMDRLVQEVTRIQAKIIRARVQNRRSNYLNRARLAFAVNVPVFACRRAYLTAGGPIYFSSDAVSGRMAQDVPSRASETQRSTCEKDPKVNVSAIQATWVNELRRIFPELGQNDIHLLNLPPLSVIRDLADYLNR